MILRLFLHTFQCVWAHMLQSCEISRWFCSRAIISLCFLHLFLLQVCNLNICYGGSSNHHACGNIMKQIILNHAISRQTAYYTPATRHIVTFIILRAVVISLLLHFTRVTLNKILSCWQCLSLPTIDFGKCALPDMAGVL